MLFEGIRGVCNTLNDRIGQNEFERNKSRYIRLSQLAPCDGKIVYTEAEVLTIRRVTGEDISVHRHPRSEPWCVRAGDTVLCGQQLTFGRRSHRALLRLWGRERFATHFVDELQLNANNHGVMIPRVYWELLVRELLAWDRVIDPGDTPFRKHQRVHQTHLAQVQADVGSRGLRPATTVPTIRPLRAIARERAVSLTETVPCNL